jgi:hypothetical protein
MTNKIYVVTSTAWHDNFIDAAFSSKEKAEKFAKDNDYDLDNETVEAIYEYELDVEE